MAETQSLEKRQYFIGAFIAFALVGVYILGSNVVGAVVGYVQTSNSANPGDIVSYDYILSLSDGTIIDTSIAAIGASENLTKTNYFPNILSLVEASETSGDINDALLRMEFGEIKDIEITFVRDPDLVWLLNRTLLFDQQGIEPEKGQSVSFENRVGAIVSYDNETVLVDFNSPLAGQTVNYELTLLKIWREI